MDKRDVYHSDEDLEQQLIASGIDMTVIPLATMIGYVRKHWDRYVANPGVKDDSLLRFEIRVEPKGTECYYENVIAAVDTGEEMEEHRRSARRHNNVFTTKQ